MAAEDPLLRRTRIEAANDMGNAMIDVLNKHINVHGQNDPELKSVLIAALLSVVHSIERGIDEEFGDVLAECLDDPDRERGDEDT